MNRRLERINALIRNTIGELLLSKISDPRIDPALTSVTRVEISEELTSARVFISVMGTETQQKLAIQALQHAAGHIQELMMRQIQLRNTPILQFQLDKQFKKTLETLRVLQQVAAEMREKDEAQKLASSSEPSDQPNQPSDASNRPNQAPPDKSQEPSQ